MADGFNTLIEQIDLHAKEHPEKEALIMKKDHMNYRELSENIKRLAFFIGSEGVNTGDRVLLSAVSKTEMVAAFLAIEYIGAIAVLVDKNATADSVFDIYKDTSASLIITDKPMKGYEDREKRLSLKELFSKASEVSPEAVPGYKIPDPENIAEIIYTTGTTGKPKGIMLTYESIYHSMNSVINGLKIREDDRYLLPLPVNHAYAIDSLRAVLFLGATIILQNGFLFAEDTRKNIEDFGCTAMSMVPSAIEILRTQFGDKFSDIMGKLRFIKFGAGQFGITLQRLLASELPGTVIYNGWGSSETSTAFLLDVSAKVKDGSDLPSIGKPIEGVEIAFLDEEGKYIDHTSPDSPGRLAVKSPCIMKGYWNNDSLTSETIIDGYVVTSDIAYQDDKGFVYILGRADDIINIGGEKVSPYEVENIAEGCEGVKECACIGIPDDKGFDKIPVLFVAGTEVQFDALVERLRNYLSDRLERFKLPREYIWISEIPRNRMNKIDRKALRKLFDERKSDPENECEDNPVLHALYTRRSIRSFTDKKIERNILDKILKAGFYAPTGHNMQTWRFTVLQGSEKIADFKEKVGLTAKENKLPFYGFENPDTAIIVSNDTRSVSPCEDSSAAIENMLLAAHSLGLGGVWIGVLATLRNAEPVKTLLDSYGIPKTHDIYGIVNLGYPASPGRLLAKKTEVVHFV